MYWQSFVKDDYVEPENDILFSFTKVSYMSV